jgi:hypothetical protein
MKIAVSDLRPNPFRHLDRYPIDRDKVDALKRSIKDTTFWDNLLVRKARNGHDGYEIAFGHHRLIALKELRESEIDVPVRKLSDTDMARIMAHENMEEWGSSAPVEQETVRSIIEGFAEGKVQLPAIKGRHDGALRHAPSFLPVGKSATDSARAESVYTADSLAQFLGWNTAKVEGILNALAVVEKGLIAEKDFAGLTSRQAQEVATQTRRVERETGRPELAKAIGTKLAHGMRSATGRPGREMPPKGFKQDVTVRTAKSVADQMMGSQRRMERRAPLPPINRFADELATVIADVFPTPKMQEKLDAVIQYRNELNTPERRALVASLRGLAKRAEKLADRIEG